MTIYYDQLTWPEINDAVADKKIPVMAVGSVEQHGLHLPMGTDFLNGLERAKLVAQRTDVLVAPILIPGLSHYHMGFPGTITLPAETIQTVYFEAAQSLMRHGFKRFLLLNAHGGNRATTRYIVDRINQETEGIAVELGEAEDAEQLEHARDHRHGCLFGRRHPEHVLAGHECNAVIARHVVQDLTQRHIVDRYASHMVVR